MTNESGSSAEDVRAVKEGEALTPAKKTRARFTPQDPLEQERRRREIARLRYVYRLTLLEIVDRLKKLDPPIECSKDTVARDLYQINKSVRRSLSAKGFDPADVVMQLLAGYDEREAICMRELQDVSKIKPGEIGRLVLAANHSAERKARILQEVGLLDRKLGTLFIDDGKKTDRIPSGVELQKIFDAVNVTDGEVVSEAENAWQYGDAAAADLAARAAVDTARDEARGEGD